MSRAYPVDRLAHGPSAILVVEDEVLVRVLLSEELRHQGYTVIEAANADEAISILQSDVRVDLVLTDVRMPGSLDGIGLARLVRTDYPALKIVMGSGDVPAARVAGIVDGFFSKPYDLTKLVTHIRSLLAAEQ